MDGGLLWTICLCGTPEQPDCPSWGLQGTTGHSRQKQALHGKTPATDASCTEMSDPAALSPDPTDTPTSAALRANRSLTPSPQYKHVLPSPCNGHRQVYQYRAHIAARCVLQVATQTHRRVIFKGKQPSCGGLSNMTFCRQHEP